MRWVRLDGGADHIRTGAQPLSVVLTDAAPVSAPRQPQVVSTTLGSIPRGLSSCIDGPSD